MKSPNGLGKLPRLTGWQPALPRQDCFRRDAETSTRDACATQSQISTRATVQCAGTMGRVSPQDVRRVNRPTSHLRDENVLLFRSTPSSNSVDRKFHVPPSATPAKSKSRESATIP